MLSDTWRDAFVDAARAEDDDLALPALLLSRLEHRDVDVGRYLARLDAMAREVQSRVAASRFGRSLAARAATINEYLFDELGFTGNDAQYNDPRNSFLNDVLDRRTGIPISLSVLYIEVARRAGIGVQGVGFPGHFLVRVGPVSHGSPDDGVLIDTFNGGTILSEAGCRQLLRRSVGEDVPFDPEYLAASSKMQILQRMLTNLKRLYVSYRSFPQALAVSDLIVNINPLAMDELRDRGLLASHLDDYPRALRDLEAWLQHVSRSPADDEARRESEQIWEHVKGLRKRIAGLN